MADMNNERETSESNFGVEKYSENILTASDTTCNGNVEANICIMYLGVVCILKFLFMCCKSCFNAEVGAGLSSEVSAIYLAMKNSKLECVDEHGQDSMSADVCVDEEEYEEFEDFDPYLFIKNLPDLSSVVPTFRPMLLPKQTRSCPPTTLVLDLDGNKIWI